MQHLIFFSIGLLAILLVPFLMWRIKASNEFKKYLPLTEKDITDFETQKPVFTKYWISNSFYKDYIDKTRILLNGSKEKFDFSNWGIALKLDVYPDKILLSSLNGLFITKRAIELKKISKIFKNKQIVAFKGSNFYFIANNFSEKQIHKLYRIKTERN